MDDLTIILIIASFVIFGTTFYFRNITINVLSVVVGICAIGQIFNDTSITDAQIPLIIIPIVAILIFSGTAIMGVGR